MKKYKKQYSVNNKEKIKIQQRKKYDKNIQQRKKYNKEKITCECGLIITKINRVRHLRSRKHKDYIAGLETESDSE